MSLQVKKDSGVKYDPVFLKILEDIPGGVTVKTNRFPSDTKEVKKGTLLNADATTAGLFNVIKTVKVAATLVSGASVVIVEPTDHLFKVGEYINLYGATASTITRVSTTAIAFGKALAFTGVIASGAILFEVGTIATATVLYAASAFLRNTIQVREKGVATLLDNVFAGAVVRGTVDESELPYFVTDADKTALTDRMRFA